MPKCKLDFWILDFNDLRCSCTETIRQMHYLWFCSRCVHLGMIFEITFHKEVGLSFEVLGCQLDLSRVFQLHVPQGESVNSSFRTGHHLGEFAKSAGDREMKQPSRTQVP